MATSKQQIKAIIKLLTLWPSCPTKTIEEYVKHSLGCKATRVCIQLAKQEMGLKEPEYEEKTTLKMRFARHACLELVNSAGFASLPDMVSQIVKILQEKFHERTNQLLVERWVADTMHEVHDTGAPSGLLQESRQEMKDVGLLEEESRQGRIPL